MRRESLKLPLGIWWSEWGGWRPGVGQARRSVLCTATYITTRSRYSGYVSADTTKGQGARRRARSVAPASCHRPCSHQRGAPATPPGGPQIPPARLPPGLRIPLDPRLDSTALTPNQDLKYSISCPKHTTPSVDNTECEFCPQGKTSQDPWKKCSKVIPEMVTILFPSN